MTGTIYMSSSALTSGYVEWSSTYQSGLTHSITFNCYGSRTDGTSQKVWRNAKVLGSWISGLSSITVQGTTLIYSGTFDVTSDGSGVANVNAYFDFGFTYTGTARPDYSGQEFSSSVTISSLQLDQPVTAPTAPTTISLAAGSNSTKANSNIYGSSMNTGAATLSWSGASAGYNNAISGYIIYRSINGGSYSQLGTTSSSVTTYTVSVSGLSDGQYATYKIVTKGASSNSSQSSASIKFYRNTPPTAPTGQPSYLPSTGGAVAINYTAGTSSNGFSITTYYSTSATGTKTLYSGQTCAAGTYYLWSYDGLDYSTSYATVSILNDTAAPVVTTITYNNTNFIPYYDEGLGYEYVTNVVPIITATNGEYSTISKYLFYYRQAAAVDEFDSASEIYISQTTANTISFIVSNYITAGNYFQIGAKVQTSLSEESAIKWSGIMCCGSTITADDFSSDLVVYSLIDDNKSDIADSTNIALYFNRWISIGWTNPINAINKFRISSIECGIYNGSNFTPISYYNSTGGTYSINVSNSGVNSSIYLDVNDTVSRGAEIYPAIRINSENGQIAIKQGEKRTRVLALNFNGVYEISISEWSYFSDNSEISFNGNKIIGDNSFAILKSATITSSIPSNKVYEAVYTTDSSSVPGHINFEDFDTFKTEVNSEETDNVVNNTYTITIVDRYGNSASTRITQVIDFRVAPVFAAGSVLTTKVAYLNDISSYVTISASTAVAYRILNPGEKIQISWPAATDSGNYAGQTMRYQVDIFNISNITSLEISGGSKVLTEIVTSTNYTYTAPTGSNTAQGIYFNVTALDRTDLTSSTLSTATSQALALGRALSPEFTVANYSIEEEGTNEGMLTGKLKISDYGDSRSIVSEWKNYERLGFILTELGGKLDEEQEPILVTLTVDDSGNITSDAGTYSTKDKITLNFTLEVTYLGLFSEQHYIFSFNGPTFSYRAHQIGINASADNVNNTSLIVGPGTANGYSKYLIRFIVNKVGWEDIDINLYEGSIQNIIIDGGTWD